MLVIYILYNISILTTEIILQTMGTTINIIEMTEKSLRQKISPMTEEGAEMQMIEEILGGIKVIVDLEIKIGLAPDIKVRKEGVMTAGSQDIFSGSVKGEEIKVSKKDRLRCSR